MHGERGVDVVNAGGADILQYYLADGGAFLHQVHLRGLGFTTNGLHKVHNLSICFFLFFFFSLFSNLCHFMQKAFSLFQQASPKTSGLYDLSWF